ncbi:MAG: amidohydrolase family protein [Nitrospinota bacterium]
MIVDCHAHIGLKAHMPAQFLEEMLQPFFRAAGAAIPASVYEGIDPEAMMKEYQQAGVDKVFVYGVSPREARVFGRDPAHRVSGAPHIPNDYVAEVHRRFPDKTVPVMAFNPAFQGAAIEKEVEYAVRELGAKALKLYPTYNHYRPDDRELCWPFYRKAQELGVPVIVHQSWTTTVDAPMKFQQPMQLDDVAREFRDLTLIIAHLGVPWVDEAMCLVAKHDNVYTDLSFWTILEMPEVILQQLLRCPRYGCTYDRILWGTDYPLTTPAESLRVFREKLPEAAKRTGLPMIPDDALELILGGNAARIYGLT